MVCRKHYATDSPAEIHHLRVGVGIGRKAIPSRTIPLCPPHHRTGNYGVAFHQGKKAFEAKYGTEEELLAYTDEALDGERPD